MIPKLEIDAVLALILALAVALFVYHERQVGRAQIEAADAKVVAAQTVHNQEVEDRARGRIEEARELFARSVQSPVVAPVSVRLCPVAPAIDTSTVSHNAAPSAGGNATSGIPDFVGPVHPAVDVGPFTDKLLERADAQITLLQDYIRECQKEGICQVSAPPNEN